MVPKQYFKKLEGTEDIWEVRADLGNDAFRLLGFWDQGRLIILTNAFAKKTQKTPAREISLAEQRRADFPEPTGEAMKDDLQKFIERRKRTDRKFAKDFESGYEEFKIGVLLRQAREQAGVTQEALARRTKTKKSAISRLENHAEDVRLSTIKRVAQALGKSLRIELVEA